MRGDMKDRVQFIVRIPAELHRRLKADARRANLSLNALCVKLLERGSETGGKEPGAFEAIVTFLQKRYRNQFLALVLFGSHARGEAQDTSDVDLMVVLHPSVSIQRSLYREIDRMFDPQISLHFAHPPLSPEGAGSLWLECALDGRVIYDGNGKVTRLLSQIRDRIVSGKVVRKVTHGQGYWVHT